MEQTTFFTSIRSKRISIDVRSPGEFAQGHVPGAINLPLLDDLERHQVGLTYKSEGRVPAVALGLEIFAAKAGRFADGIREGDTPLDVGVYCWRGGMRSQAVATWLRLHGYQVALLPGGYKAFRREVAAHIEALAARPLLVLVGRTGVGKTEFLQHLPNTIATIDLEGLAVHRGSAFGDFAQEANQPTQQGFENALALAVDRVGDQPYVVVEIENYFGPIAVPKKLRDALMAAPLLLLTRDFESRVTALEKVYAAAWNAGTQTLFESRLELLRRYLSQAEIADLIRATREGNFRDAVRLLLTRRYDPIYDKGLKRFEERVVARVDVTSGYDEAISFLKNYAPPSKIHVNL